MTSHASRFPTLGDFFREFENQTLRPNRLLLYLTEEDFQLFHRKGIYQPDYLELRVSENLGPAKKLIPALRDFPNQIIVTIDDDVIYSNNHLETLLAVSRKYPKNIIEGRAHLITLNDAENPNLYSEWIPEVTCSNLESKLIFPTGVGMILYPPNSLHPDVLDTITYLDLCPFQDDLWFYIHSNRNGTLNRVVQSEGKLEYLEGTQSAGLWETVNSLGSNDVALNRLLKKYTDIKFD